LLAGITRGLLIDEIAPGAGIKLREATIRPEDFKGLDECFLLSTTKDVTPVRSIDANVFKLGEGTVTLKLKAAFADYVRAYIAKHPELRVN